MKRVAVMTVSAAMCVGTMATVTTSATADPNQTLDAANHAVNALAAGLAPVAGMGIETFAGATNVCGAANVVPLLVANYTNVSQTGSMTVDGDLAEQVIINPSQYQSGPCPQRSGSGMWHQNGNSYSYDYTVQPGQVATFMVALGGVNENLITSSHTFSIGGDPSGASDGQWYDFDLTLNADESFKYLQSNYSSTGGTDSATNTQNGFNILSCNPVVPVNGQPLIAGGPVASPYSSGNANGPGYGWGAGICLGWLPDGQNVTGAVTTSGDAVTSVVAAQYNPELQTVSMVLNSFEVNNVQVMTDSGQLVSLPQTPGSPDGFWRQVNANQLLVEGIPAYAQTSVVVTGGVSGFYQSTVVVPTSSPAWAPPVPAAKWSTSTSLTPDYEALSFLGVTPVGQSSSAISAQFTFQVAYVNAPPKPRLYLTSLTAPNGTTTAYNFMFPVFDVGRTYAIVNIPLSATQAALSGGKGATYTANLVLAPTNGGIDSPQAQQYTAQVTVTPPA